MPGPALNTAVTPLAASTSTTRSPASPSPRPSRILERSAKTPVDRTAPHGVTAQAVEIPARNSRVVPVNIRAPFRESLAAGAVLLLMGRLPYALRMTLHLDTPVGAIPLPLTHEGTLTPGG